MLRTHHIFITDTEDYIKDNGENDKDHDYDSCYGKDTDKYDEHLGSIDSG